MPTYQYRCSHCQGLQSIVHGMLEEICPVCEQCGGFMKKVVVEAPQIVHSQIESLEPQTEIHQCSSGCVLHRQDQLPKSTPYSQQG